MKKIVSIVLVMIIALSFAACGNKGGADGKGSQLLSKELKASDLSIDDFEWETKPGKSSGYDCYIFTLTNNSKYDLISVNIIYKVKSDVSDDQLKVYSDFMNDHEGYIEEDDSPRNVTLKGYRDVLVSKGEKVTNIILAVGYEDLFWYDSPTLEQFELMEPKELQLGIVGENNTLYLAYYNFESKNWILDEETVVVDKWPTSEIASKIEKPEGKHFVIVEDEDDDFEFYSFGVTKEAYNAYTKKMAELGFVDDDPSDYYSATNSEGYEIDLWYDEDDNTLEVSIDK